MIDDNKIEEAAVKSANYLKGICDFTVINAFEEGFKEGAKWAVNELLKDLWHPASEEPEKNHFVLFKTAGNSFETEYIGKNDWATIVRCFKVVKWFYVDDLGYITNNLIYNEEDNSLMIVTDTFRKVRRNGKD